MKSPRFFKRCLPTWTLTLALAAGISFSWTAIGCGPSLSYSVPPDLIKRLPKSSRRSVFQAETVVTIAVDRKSSVNREIENTKREIVRAASKIAKAKKRQDSAGDQAANKIDREIDMLDAQGDYLAAKLDHLAVRYRLALMELVLANAQFELSKVKLVKKHSIAFDEDEADFVDQVKSIQADVDDFRKDVEEDAAELKRDEAVWLAVKKKFFSSIGESAKGWWTE